MDVSEIAASATEYLRLGQNDELTVIEQQIDDAIRSADHSDRIALLEEAEGLFRGVAKDVSPDDEDRLRVLLEMIERKRSNLS